jgi:hypothetical protein
MTNVQKPDYGFNIETKGDTTHISGKGAGFGIGGHIVMTFGLLMLTSFIAPLFFLVLNLQSAAPMWIVSALIFGGMYYGIYKLKSRPFAFDITPQGIMVDGALYTSGDITNIYLSNSNDGKTAAHTRTPGMMILSNNPVLMTAMATHAISGAAFSAMGSASSKAGRVTSWRVGLRYGKKNIVLAKSLKEDVANAMFDLLTENKEQ